MDCPRCGWTGASVPACARCGVVFAKLRTARPRQDEPSEPPRASGRVWLVLGAVVLLLLIVGAILRSRQPEDEEPARPVAAARKPNRAVVQRPEEPPPPPALDPVPPSIVEPPEDSGISAEDVRLLNELAQRMRSASASVGADDLRNVEAVYARHPDLDAVRQYLEAVLVRIALTLRSQGNSAEAEAHLRRAASLSPTSLAPRMALTDVLLEAQNWAGAEAVAREILALSPRDAEAMDRLAFGLYRQDRNREAADVLRESLAIRESATSRSLLARIEKGLQDESGMSEQKLSHFNVRYDGEAHEEVGREVLRALERHYSTLVSTLDHEPRNTIPVILFSRDAYYDASGAPRWSGGVYDNMDGRIRVPIGGLDASLGPEMDGTLIHELVHAFAAEITGGLTPRDVNEGLAQYAEGKRVGTLLRPEEVRALAQGRIGGVAGTYLNALSFVEYLMAQRGQGGVNDLLRTMGESRDVDKAFRAVYGGSAVETRQAWQTFLRRSS